MTARNEVALHDAADTPLGELVALVPSSSRVLLRYGLDYCCGGAQTLEDACQTQGLEVERVLLELREVSGEAPAMPWETASVQEIIAHILKVYHAPLREGALPRGSRWQTSSPRSTRCLPTSLLGSGAPCH